jgi:uncharacterized protein YeaO (DUF488 family)
LIKIKRVYEEPSEDDGVRILIDRLWPRGLSKEKAKVDRWAKEISPSTELRKWYGHDPAKSEEFEKRYRKELDDKKNELEELAKSAHGKTVTLLYASKDEHLNQAVVLKEILGEI